MNYAVSVVFLHRLYVNLSPVYFMKIFEHVFKKKLWFDFVFVSQCFSVFWLIRYTLLLTEIIFPQTKGHYTANGLPTYVMHSFLLVLCIGVECVICFSTLSEPHQVLNHLGSIARTICCFLFSFSSWPHRRLFLKR